MIDINTAGIELQAGDTLTLNALCRILPPRDNGHRPNPKTVLRWITKGVNAPDGQVIRLAAVRVGSKWITTRRAAQEFIAALTAAALGDEVAAGPPPRSAGQRRRDHERALAELEAAGI
jgi:hypothetical protein